MFAIIGQLVFGWLLADLIGGFVHWLEDRMLPEGTPGLRRAIAAQRLHHARPGAFLEHSATQRGRDAFLVALAAALGLLALLGPSLWLLVAFVGGAVSTEVHAWAHSPSRCGKVIRVLQDTGILQSPKHHAGHHRPPHEGRYCPLTDWLNPVLDALGVWGRLERLLRRKQA